MRQQPILEKFSPELIYIKGFKNIIADGLNHLDKIDQLNYTNSINSNEAYPTLESLSENFALNKEDIHLPASFKTIMRFQQKDISAIKIAKEKTERLLH